MRIPKQQTAVAVALLQKAQGSGWGCDLGGQASFRLSVLDPMLSRSIEPASERNLEVDCPRRCYVLINIRMCEHVSDAECSPSASCSMNKAALGLRGILSE